MCVRTQTGAGTGRLDPDSLMVIMILHIDMDAFFASVEELDNPRLQGKCVIVGKQSPRSVVAAANYAARKFGVHSAMPMYQAKQKCPDAIFLPPRMDRYQELSNQIISLLKQFSPLVEPVSIDGLTWILPAAPGFMESRRNWV